MSRVLHLRDRCVDLDTGRIGPGPQTLRSMELKLLRYLAERAGAVISHEELLESVWGYAASSRTRTVYTTWARLKAALEIDPRHPTHLQTVAGRGLRLVTDAPAPPSGNLRAPRDRMVGRTGELAWLAQDNGPLVTIVGPGGLGKTRLALEHAARLALPGGVWRCDLVEAGDARAAAQRLAEVLGLSLLDPLRDLPRHLATRPPTLVVLDDADAVSDLPQALADWIEAAPDMRFLATAHAPLGLPFERRLHLAPLSLPSGRSEEDSEALTLFLERARAARQDFDPVQAELRELVVALDGLPLAIEIAAAHAAQLGPRTVLDALSAPEELTDPRPDTPERHRSLGRVIAWSWQRLPDGDRLALLELAAFARSFTLAAARDVLSPQEGRKALPIVMGLVERGWLAQTPEPGEPRFAMLHTLRRHIAQGSALEPARQRHAEHFGRRAQALVAPTGGLVPDPLEPLLPDLDEWLHAARWALEREVAHAEVLVEAALRVAAFAGRSDTALALALAAEEAPAPVRLRARAWRAECAAESGRYAEAFSLWASVAEEADRASSFALAANARLRASIARYNLGQREEARQLLEEAQPAVARAQGPQALGHYLKALDTYARAGLSPGLDQRALIRQAAHHFGAAGWPLASASAHSTLAGTLYFSGRPDEAEPEFRHVLRLLPARARRQRALATCGLARILADRGELLEAHARLDQALEQLEGTHREVLSFLLVHRARIRCALGDLEGAAMDAGESLRLALADGQHRLAAMARVILGRIGRRRHDASAVPLLREALEQAVELHLADTAREALAEWVDGALAAGLAPQDLLAASVPAASIGHKLGTARAAIALLRAELHRLAADPRGALLELEGADTEAPPQLAAAIRLHRAALCAEAGAAPAPPSPADLAADEPWARLQRARWLKVVGRTEEAAHCLRQVAPAPWETLLKRAVEAE